MQDDIVPVDVRIQSRTELDDRALEHRIFKGDDIPAVRAEQVVMMLTARVGRLETGGSVAYIDALDEPQVQEYLEHPVDTRDSNGSAAVAQLVKDLLRRETAFLRCELLDHSSTGTSGSISGAPERFERMRCPVECACRHPNENDSDSQNDGRPSEPVPCRRTRSLGCDAAY